MEDKVLKNMIELYKAKGISLDKLLSNPTFTNLPVDAKIKLVKKYAEHLHSGIKFDRSDAMNLLKMFGAGAGAYGVFRLGSAIMGKVINLPPNASDDQINLAAKNAVATVAPLALAMVPTGALFVQSLADTANSFNRKQEMKNYLQAIKRNQAPDSNAIRALASASGSNKE